MMAIFAQLRTADYFSPAEWACSQEQAYLARVFLGSPG
jgi:hypothetical protein